MMSRMLYAVMELIPSYKTWSWFDRNVGHRLILAENNSRAFALVLWHEQRLVNPWRLSNRDYFTYGVR